MRVNIESFILRRWLTGLWNLASPECRVNQQAEEQGTGDALVSVPRPFVGRIPL